jgi:hypothetical protein
MGNIKSISLIKMDFEDTGLNVITQWLALMLYIWIGFKFWPVDQLTKLWLSLVPPVKCCGSAAN